MPSFDALDPLGPDACQFNRHAVCRYYHLKLQALNGGFDKLTDEERAFVGVQVSPHEDTFTYVNGWHSPIAGLIDLVGANLTPADVHMLERLAGMDVPPQERLEFLGD